MDYERIYREFIADRKTFQHPKGAYVERHHVVPRALGGTDEPANIVALTPEDHYFAHLLLAKWVGGTMWFAVKMMDCRRNGLRAEWVKARVGYAIARRRAARLTSARCKGQPGRKGRANARYCHKIHVWANVDTGEVRRSTKSDMQAAFGGCRAHWTSAVSGDRKTMLGWTPYPERVVCRSSKGKTFDFVNVDGRTFSGTQKAFCALTGLSPASASRIVRGQAESRCGWSRASVVLTAS